MVGYALNAEMFKSNAVNFHSFDGNKNGSPKEHKFRILPAYAEGKLFHKDGLHWGFKEAGGNQRALKCTLEQYGSCPICDKIKMLKGQVENITAALTSEYDPQQRAALEQQKVDAEAYIDEHRRKPMFLWNILTESGEQKVLQLSYNAHTPLQKKVEFIFDKQKIDVTNFTNNTLMFVNRSGLKSKTNYQYEMLPGLEKDLTNEVTELSELDKIYPNRTLEYMQNVVETEIVPPEGQQKTVAPEDKTNYQTPSQEKVPVNNVAAAPMNTPDPSHNAAASEAHTQQAPHPADMANAETNVPASQNQVSTPSQTPQTEAKAHTPAPDVNLTPEQDASVANMMNALK